ncbi:MFS transporter [Dehalococcoidia bacterium]|nr:MFS transporter [Dehalococcoidia bacterium]MCL0104641.1 MFS transporter [Dehalococcoidia bacterium]
MNNGNNLSLFRRLAYSAGYTGTMLIGELAVVWIIFFYAPPEGMVFAPVLLVGYVVFFGRVVDAIADPLVGHFSDKSKSRFGRRIPFIAVGTPFLVISWILIFHPPVAAESVVNALYLAVVLGFFWIFFTVVVAPHLALLPEIVSARSERINLATYLAIFGILGLFIAFLGSGFLVEHFDFGVMAIVMGSIAFISFYVPVVFVRETPWSRAKEVSLSLTEAIKHCFTNRPFLYYVSAFAIFLVMGIAVVTAAVPFIVTVLMGVGEEWAGYALGMMTGVALLSFPIINYLAKRFGKKTVFAASMLLFSILASMLGTIGVFPFAPFYHGLFLIALMGVAVSSFLMLNHAIIADIIDHDEIITGFRREAIYYGVQGLVQKSGIGVSALIFTLLLHLFGKTAAEPLGVTLAGPVAGILVFVGFLVFLKYPFRK